MTREEVKFLVSQINDMMTFANATLTEYQEDVLYAVLKVILIDDEE